MTTLYESDLLQTARDISSNISSLDGCLGVVLGGSVARGQYRDADSQDLDIYVYLTTSVYDMYVASEGCNPRWPWVFDIDFRSIPLSIQLLDYERLQNASISYEIWTASDHIWTQSNRWDKSFSKILYERQRLITELFVQKLTFSDEEQIFLERQAYFEFSSILTVDVRAYEQRKMWIEAHQQINKCVDLLVRLAYIHSKLFIPPEKWKYWWFRQLDSIHSTSFNDILDCLRVSDIDAETDIVNRKHRLLSLYNNITQLTDTANDIVHKSSSINNSKCKTPDWLTKIFEKE